MRLSNMTTCEKCGQTGPEAVPCTSNGGEFPCTVGLVCAWCDLVLVPGPEPVSHGICPECAEAVEREAVDKPRGDDTDERSNPRWDRDDSHERRELADELRADEARR